MSARRLLPYAWLVGSGTDETAFTDRYDCHCYLIADQAGGVLIDTGAGLATERWLEQVDQACAVLDLEPSGLAGVVLTHYHADHAGGAAAARAAGLPLIASAVTAEALAVGDEERTSVARARAVGVYPSDYRLLPADVEVVVEDGRQVYAGPGVRVTVLDAPGHCDGHVVVLVEPTGRVEPTGEAGGRSSGARCLMTGDCLFAGGRVSLQALPDCRLDAYARTVIRLADLRPDAVLAGHGEPVLSGAARDVEAAAASFARLVPPRNILDP